MSVMLIFLGQVTTTVEVVASDLPWHQGKSIFFFKNISWALLRVLFAGIVGIISLFSRTSLSLLFSECRSRYFSKQRSRSPRVPLLQKIATDMSRSVKPLLHYRNYRIYSATAGVHTLTLCHPVLESCPIDLRARNHKVFPTAERVKLRWMGRFPCTHILLITFNDSNAKVITFGMYPFKCSGTREILHRLDVLHSW